MSNKLNKSKKAGWKTGKKKFEGVSAPQNVPNSKKVGWKAEKRKLKDISAPQNVPNSKKRKVEPVIDEKSDALVIDEKSDAPELNTSSEASWNNLKVSPQLRKAIDTLNFEKMTEIQHKAIPTILNGNDLAAAAKTGSGKTLSFMIPAVELLIKDKRDSKMGTAVLVLAPTRELAIQIKEVSTQITKFLPEIRTGLVIGGGPRKTEQTLLESGCEILVATPGRLLDHLKTTKFELKNLKILIIDEADHMLDIGFEKQMLQILNRLPAKRQTLLFSATLTGKTHKLLKVALKQEPIFVEVKGEESAPTADKLVQMYTVLPQDQKLPALLTWLRQHENEKVLIFFSTKNSTRFYGKLFNKMGIEVKALYGSMPQGRRTKIFFEFVKAQKGILLATDIASRGLDFPSVHWIVQFDPSHQPKEYIHRVGRTARAGLTGEALTFLQPTELNYLNALRGCDLELKQVEIEKADFDGEQKKVEDAVAADHALKASAKKACRSFCRCYKMKQRVLFKNKGIDRKQAAKSFGLVENV